MGRKSGSHQDHRGKHSKVLTHGILPMCRTCHTDITSPTVGRSHGAQWNSGPDRELKLELLLRVLFASSAGFAWRIMSAPESGPKVVATNWSIPRVNDCLAVVPCLLPCT